jgi:hypothetical protein
MVNQAERQAKEEADALKRKDDEEKASRAARKAALNAKWGGSSVAQNVATKRASIKLTAAAAAEITQQV